MWSKAKDKDLGNLSHRVRELFEYNPNDGHLRWKIARQKINKGDIAGYVSKSDGYRYVCFDYNELLSHRIIWLLMTGDWPKCQIDHKNGVRDDNKWSNLREATNSQNNLNKGIQKNNKLGEKYIWYDPKRKQYRLKMRVRGTEYIERFTTLEEAVKQRQLVEEVFPDEYAKKT